jgi:hypothetical protein
MSSIAETGLVFEISASIAPIFSLSTSDTENIKPVVQEFLQSGIAVDVFVANLELVPDLEIDPLTQEVVSTPIDDALGFRYTRFGPSAKKNRVAALFKQENGDIWQAKIFGVNITNQRTGEYLAPKGIGDVPYLPNYPRSVQLEIAAKYGIQPAADDESFWEWFLRHPQIPLDITEGGKKALAAISQNRVALSLFGCTCGVGPDGKIKPFLEPYIKNRPINILFDEDEKESTRVKVRGATLRLGKALLKSGATLVQVAEWDNTDGKGIDDLIAKNPLKFHQVVASAKDFKQWSRHNYDLKSLDRVEVIDSHWLPELTSPEEANLLCIKARKGGGKTTQLAVLAQKAMNRGQRVLIITHRVSLGKELCRRFGVAHVQHLQDEPTGTLFGYGLCIDSLHPNAQQTRFQYEEWAEAMVIVDEAEQVFWHGLNAQTLGNNRTAVLETLGNLFQCVIKTGGKIILSDADLSLKSFDYVRKLVGNPELLHPWILINENVSPIKKDCLTYNSKETWLAGLIKTLTAGQRAFCIVSGQKVSSKFGTLTLEKMLAKKFPSKKFLRVDSESISDPNHPAYDCMAEIALADGTVRSQLSLILAENQYDGVIASPTIETGISLEGDWFDAVFALGNGIQTVEGFCQTLERYRPPVVRHIFVSTANPSSTIGNGCDYAKGLLEANSLKTISIQRVWAALAIADMNLTLDGLPSAHLEAWARFAADHNYGFHHYRECIYEKLIQEGYSLRPYDDKYQALTASIAELEQSLEYPKQDARQLLALDREVLHYGEEDTKAIAAELTRTREQNLEEWAEAVVAADPYTPEEYQAIEAKKSKTQKERLREHKTRISHTYGIPITPTIAKADIEGKLFASLQLFYYFTVGREYLPQKERERIGTGNLFAPDLNRRTLAGKIVLLDLINTQQFLDSSVSFTSQCLQEWFDSNILPYRHQIRHFLGIAITAKCSPIQFVQNLMQKLGLRLTCNRHRIKGQIVREYRYDPTKIALAPERSLILMAWQRKDQQKADCLDIAPASICDSSLNRSINIQEESPQSPDQSKAPLLRALEADLNTGNDTISLTRNSKPQRRIKGDGSGYVRRHDCTSRTGKAYEQHYYHYEIWENGSRQVKSCCYIPKARLEQVRELEANKAPVIQILQVLGKRV